MYENTASFLPQLARTLNLPHNLENFSDVLEQELEDILSKYSDSIIAEDCLVMAKQDIGEIKSLRKAIKDNAKQIIAELEKPVLDFKSKIGDLDSKCQEVELKISDRIAFFKQQEIENLKDLLITEINKELRRNFLDIGLASQVDINCFLKAPSKCLTKGGVLTKFAKDGIEEQVEKLLKTHQVQEMNTTIKMPNTAQNMEMSCGSNDKSKEPIKSSVNNTQMVESSATKEAIGSNSGDLVRKAEVEVKQISTENKSKARKLVAVFELEVDENISNEKLAEILRLRLEKSGFKSLKSITAF